MNNADLPEGYKLTEVGVIPEDWEVRFLSNLLVAGPKNGYSGRSGKNAEGTLTLSLGATTSGRMILTSETIKCLEERVKEGSDLFLQPGDILVQRSNTIEIVGTTALFDGPPGVFVYPDLMMRLRFRDSETAHWFWRYANSSSGRRYFVSVAAGSSGSMPKISGERLRHMQLPLPSLPEQRSIATALSDMDELLGGLDRLIAKKRDLKQAAMQQFLTGEVRLPGFDREWEVKRLGGAMTICHGRSQHEVQDQNGLYPILATGGQIGSARSFLYDKPSVLIGRKGTIDQPKYMDTPFWTVDTLFYSVIHDFNNAKFIFYRFCLIDWYKYNEASGVPSLNARTIENIEVSFPKPEEQTAIATILSDMDTELTALERRRHKTRNLKQAMMQELLTGRIRLT